MQKKNILNAYVGEIEGMALLSDKEEYQLALRIQEGDQAAVNELVIANLRFVLSLARQYTLQGIDFEDLVSEGNMAMMKAAQRYNPSAGKRFVLFAAPIIRDALETFVQQQSGIYRVPRNEATEAERRWSKAASVDAPIPAGSNNNFNLLNLLVNGNAPFADSMLTKESAIASCLKAFEILDQRQRQVMTFIYGVGTDSHSMAEVAGLMGLKRERVRQIRDTALRKLKKTNVLEK
jgi:RNA polymerase primary sigma factor